MKPNHHETERILREARVKIETHGWAKGTARDGAGAYCMDAAIESINGKVAFEDRGEARVEAKRLVLNLTGTTSIPSYNDRATTTKNDVLTILRAAEQIAHEYAMETT